LVKGGKAKLFKGSIDGVAGDGDGVKFFWPPPMHFPLSVFHSSFEHSMLLYVSVITFHCNTSLTKNRKDNAPIL
jgi:hypothetical protein